MTDLFDLFDEITPKEVEKKIEKKVVKKDTKPKEIKSTQKDSSEKSFIFPFMMHFGGEMRDVTHIFTNGNEYSEKQITDRMLQHQFYEFSGEVKYSYHEEDNVLVPMFTQFKKG